MTRNPRIEYDGAIYHVFQRGNNKENIFGEDLDKGFFLKKLKEYISTYKANLLAYVIMDNHYHLIIQTTTIPLQKIMHSLNNVYVKYYNKHYDRTGHVFESRYNCELVDDNSYLLWLLRYVHRNPVKANICSDVSKYKWSSDFLYRTNINSYVEINFILNIISNNRIKANKTYLDLVGIVEKEGEEDYAYINNLVLKNISSCSKNKYVRKDLHEIITLLNISEVDRQLIKSGCRKRDLTNHKVIFIQEALKYKYTLKEISDFLGISIPSVSNLSKNK